MAAYEQLHVRVPNATFHLEYAISSDDLDCPQLPGGIFQFKERTAYGLLLQPSHTDTPLYWYVDDVQKSLVALPLVRTLANMAPGRTIVWREPKRKVEYARMNASDHELIELQPIDYEVLVDGVKVHDEHLRHGGVYALLIGGDGEMRSHMVTVTPPNSLNVLWMLPQYIVLTMGEVMFAVTGLEFSYSQAPSSMKSVLQAVYMLTVAFGNVIVVLIAELRTFDSQAMESFLFAGLMFFDMLAFMWLANRYVSNDAVRKAQRAPQHTVKYVHPKYTKMSDD